MWYCRRCRRCRHSFHRHAASAATATAAAAAARYQGATAPAIKAGNQASSHVPGSQNDLRYTLPRVLFHKPTNTLMLYKQTSVMLLEELEGRAIKDKMLFVPHMESKGKGNAGKTAAHVGCCHAAPALREAA